MRPSPQVCGSHARTLGFFLNRACPAWCAAGVGPRTGSSKLTESGFAQASQPVGANRTTWRVRPLRQCPKHVVS